MKLTVFDVETIKAFDEVGGYHPEKLGVSVIGAYHADDTLERGEFVSYKEAEFPQFFREIEVADLVVGFNTIGFDYPALTPYYPGDFGQLPNLDIILEVERKVGHRVSLDALAKQTLGVQKSGKGLDAIRYYQEGDWDSLIKYCLQDVKVTKDLYEYGLKHKSLSFRNKWNRVIEFPVDFERKGSEKGKVQTTLF